MVAEVGAERDRVIPDGREGTIELDAGLAAIIPGTVAEDGEREEVNEASRREVP